MPELPEVEIVKQSLIKNVKSEKIIKVIVRNRNLRFKLPKNFKNIIEKQKIINVTRFSKYVILEFSNNLFNNSIITNFENLVTFLIVCFSKVLLNFVGILNLKFRFLTITFRIFSDFTFFTSDCLTISTSGNSGI